MTDHTAAAGGALLLAWLGLRRCIALHCNRDAIVVCTLDGPVVTNIRALLTPPPNRELRVSQESGGRMEDRGTTFFLLDLVVVGSAFFHFLSSCS